MSLIQQLEQQYSTLSASLTANIARVQRSEEGDRKQVISETRRQIADIDELLEQMELLAPDVEDERERRKYQNTVNSFKTDAKLLKAEFEKAASKLRGDEDSMADEAFVLSDSQRSRLIDNTSILERSNKVLVDSCTVALETENIGSETLKNLEMQKATIRNARERILDADEHLQQSNRFMVKIVRRLMQDRVILLAVFGIFVMVGCAIIFLIVNKLAL